MSTPILAIYFDDPLPFGYPFDNPNYCESYWDFCQEIQKRHWKVVIARGVQSYLGNMKFTQGFVMTSKTTVESYDAPFIATRIYRKGNKIQTSVTDTVINHNELEQLCFDKRITYTLFPEFIAPCYEIDKTNWQEVIKKITTEKVVVKPVFGKEGTGIVVVPKNEFVFDLLDSTHTPFIAQEFVDSSCGIPGLFTGMHDLRIYVCNGVSKIANVRQPKKGGYLANVAQGGTLQPIALESLPQSAFDCVKKIDEHLKQFFPRIYAVDLMYSNGVPFLVELNSKPGLPYPEWEAHDHYYSKLHSYLIDALLV